jgi:GT2 family glycosyltransferase
MKDAECPVRVSLILCTKNGGDRLLTCLRHIDAQVTPHALDLVLVDNGSTDGVSYQRLLDFDAKARFPTQVLQTFVPGNSAGRNVAIAAAKGDLLLFIDDDCYADADFVAQWVAVFADRPELGFASGMIRRHTPQQDMLGCIEAPEIRPLAPGQFVPNGFIQGSNMAFRRACLQAAGPFDERFGAGTPFAGEEWELCVRASFLGWGGGYFPGPRVSHDHRRVGSEARERSLYYAFGAGGVFAKSILLHGGRNRLVCLYYCLRSLKRHARDLGFLRQFARGFVALGRQAIRQH